MITNMKFTDFKFRYILMALVMSMSINICAFADAEQETPAETVTEETVQELTLEEEPTEEELAQAAAEAAARERRELNEKLYNENSEPVNLLTTLGVIDSSYKNTLSDKITRGEFLKILLKTVKLDIDSMPSDRIFYDVNKESEYATLVHTAYLAGIIVGVSVDVFEPERTVEYSEALRMAVRALNYRELADAMGGKDVHYINIARNLGLLKNLSSDKDVTKASAIRLLFNMLDTDTVALSISGTGVNKIEETDEGNLLNSKWDTIRYKGIVTATPKSMFLEDKKKHNGYVKIGGAEYKTISDKVDIDENLLGKEVYYYLNDDNEIVLIGETDKNKMIVVDAEDLASGNTSSKVSYYPDGSDKKKNLSIASNAVIFYNGLRSFVTDNDDFNISDGKIRLVDNNDDDEYEYVFIEKYDVTDVVETSVMGRLTTKYKHLVLDKATTDNILFYRDDIEINSNYLGEWDVIKLCRDKKGNYVMANTSYKEVDGVIVGVEDDEVILDSGDRMKISDTYKTAMQNKHFQAYDLAMDTKATFVTDDTGRLFGIRDISAKKENYGFLISASREAKKSQVKIFTVNGSVEVLDMAKNAKVNGKRMTSSDVYEKFTDKSGNFAPQLIKYALNNLNEVSLIKKAVDATETGGDVNEFSLDDRLTTGNWKFSNNEITATKTHYVSNNEPKPVVFYIPYDLNEKDYYRCTDGSMLSSFTKNTDCYIYDTKQFSSEYAYDYVGAVCLRARASTVEDVGTDGPYNITAVESSNYNYTIIVDKVVMAMADDEVARYRLTGVAYAYNAYMDFDGYFAETVWNADRENNLGYGTLKVSDLKHGDVIRVGYQLASANLPLIDRFAVYARAEDYCNVDNIKAQYILNDNDTTIDKVNPRYLIGQIISVVNNNMIIRYRDYAGTEKFLVANKYAGYANKGFVLYNKTTGTISAAHELLICKDALIYIPYTTSISYGIIVGEE